MFENNNIARIKKAILERLMGIESEINQAVADRDKYVYGDNINYFAIIKKGGPLALQITNKINGFSFINATSETIEITFDAEHSESLLPVTLSGNVLNSDLLQAISRYNQTLSTIDGKFRNQNVGFDKQHNEIKGLYIIERTSFIESFLKNKVALMLGLDKEILRGNLTKTLEERLVKVEEYINEKTRIDEMFIYRDKPHVLDKRELTFENVYNIYLDLAKECLMEYNGDEVVKVTFIKKSYLFKGHLLTKHIGIGKTISPYANSVITYYGNPSKPLYTTIGNSVVKVEPDITTHASDFIIFKRAEGKSEQLLLLEDNEFEAYGFYRSYNLAYLSINDFSPVNDEVYIDELSGINAELEHKLLKLEEDNNKLNHKLAKMELEMINNEATHKLKVADHKLKEIDIKSKSVNTNVKTLDSAITTGLKLVNQFSSF